MSKAAEAWLADPNRRYGVGYGSPAYCVQYVECSHCKAPAGELCQGRLGPTLGHHTARGYTYLHRRRRGEAGPFRKSLGAEMALAQQLPERVRYLLKLVHEQSEAGEHHEDATYQKSLHVPCDPKLGEGC